MLQKKLKVVHKAGELSGSNIADAVTKLNDDKIVETDQNPRNIEEIIILLDQRDEILN